MSLVMKLDRVGLKYRLRRKFQGSSSFWALRDISFELKSGETLGIIGSNGAGKSTLMKMLAGIMAPDRGVFWSRPNLRVTLLAIGTGFESHLSGKENAILNSMLLGVNLRRALRNLPAIHEFSGLGDFFYQPVYTYSSGMLARLGFSTAMQVDPDVILMDEVMGVGDLSFAEKSKQALTGLIQSEKTIVIISHDPHTIRSLCSRACWVQDGKTQIVGSVSEVTKAYEDFVHGHAGLLNP